MALDPAGGGCDGDFAAAQVIEMQTGVQCVELQQRLTPLELARAAAKLGREYGTALLVVERNYQQARIAQIQAEAARYADTAALFQALGGGWWNRTAPAAVTASQSSTNSQ